MCACSIYELSGMTRTVTLAASGLSPELWQGEAEIVWADQKPFLETRITRPILGRIPQGSQPLAC